MILILLFSGNVVSIINVYQGVAQPGPERLPWGERGDE